MKKILTITLLNLLLISGIAMASPNNKVSDTFAQSFSLNWAGYADTSLGSYGSVSSIWAVPTIAATSTGYSSVWIGIGGYNGNSVIQIGTEQDCLSGSLFGVERYHGFNDRKIAGRTLVDRGVIPETTRTLCKPTYNAWWELYPQNAEQPIPACSAKVKSNCITVKPGDTITASVISNSDGTWTLTINDGTQSFSTTQKPTFTPDVASAEAIVERPALCNRYFCQLTSLANFGKATFSVASPISSSSNTINMVNNRGQTMATSSAFSSGTGTVTWVRSS